MEETKQEGLTLSLLSVVVQSDGCTRQVRNVKLTLEQDGSIYLMEKEEKVCLLGQGKKLDSVFDTHRGNIANAYYVDKLELKVEVIKNAYLYEDSKGRTWIFSMH
jgi:hypothetical protein